MTPTRALAVLLLLSLAATPARADDDDPADPPHVRVTDRRLRVLFEEGKGSSPTFQALVSRLEESDVVVYVEEDRSSTDGFEGRLSFLSVVGGTRYLLIRLVPLASPIQQLAMMAHELQHAVEVADNPDVVDEASLFREYMRIGYLNGVTSTGLAVDTRAAIETAALVAQELRSGPKVPINLDD
jgi:hypothetical protein